MIKNKLLLPVLLIFVLQLIVFWPSFKLSLFGDDWLAFWRYETIVNVDPYQQGYNYLTYFLTPYGPQDITMGLISRVFGYNPLPYFIISFILRFLLVMSIFFAFLELTKNRLGAFAAALFFSITIIGLETTNWVFNMPSYVGLTFFIGFLVFYVRSFNTNQVKNFIIAYTLLFFALIIVPIRMHGVIPLIVFAETLRLLKSKNISGLKLFLGRLFLLILTFWVVKQIGHSFGNPQETVDRLTNGVATIMKFIRQEKIEEVVLFPITTFGNMIFPEVLWGKVHRFFQFPIFGRPRPFPLLSLNIFLCYIFIATRAKRVGNRKDLMLFAFWGLLFNYIVYVFYKISPVTFVSIPALGSTLVGGYAFIFFSLLISLNYIDKKYYIFSLMVLILPILFMLLPWFMNSATIFPANHRYMIVSAVGVSFLWGLLFLTKIEKRFLLALLAISLVINGYVSRSYFNNLAQKRDVAISKKIWDVVYPGIPKYSGQKYYVVYFEGEGSNGDVVHSNAFFGFPPRISVVQKIINKDDIPIAITSYSELEEIASTGKGLVGHAKKEEAIPLERIYAFKIIGNSKENIKVENITDNVRLKLKSEQLN